MTTTRSDVRRAYYEARPPESRMVLAAPQVREDGDGGMVLAGYASVTDAPYEVQDWLGSYTETIARGAFAKSLRESDDVRLLVNHDGIPLARTRSGTLMLREVLDPLTDPQAMGQTGLWCEARIDGASPLAQMVRSAVSRGDMGEMSFAFSATRQDWSEDWSERTVTEVRLFDVSVVTYPANPATSITFNSARLAGIAARMAAGRALTDPDDIATAQRALAVLEALRADDQDRDGPGEPDPAAEGDDDARARALALMQARAHRA